MSFVVDEICKLIPTGVVVYLVVSYDGPAWAAFGFAVVTYLLAGIRCGTPNDQPKC